MSSKARAGSGDHGFSWASWRPTVVIARLVAAGATCLGDGPTIDGLRQ